MKLNLFNIYSFLFSFFDGGFAGFKLEIPMLFYAFFLIPYLWPIIIVFDFIIHWIVFTISTKILRISVQNITNKNRIIFKSALFGFLFDLLTIITMMALSGIVGELFVTDENFIYAITYNIFKSIPALLIMLFSMFINRCCFYLFNMRYNISKLEIEGDKMKKLNLYLTIFTAPYIYLTPFDMFFK